jgi:DNA-binding CsgD family transcriptional regulator
MELHIATGRESRHNQLTDRQLEVLQCVVTGAPAKQIAQDLNISIHTVNAHLREVYLKLQARGRVDATRWYLSRHFNSSPP